MAYSQQAIDSLVSDTKKAMELMKNNSLLTFAGTGVLMDREHFLELFDDYKFQKYDDKYFKGKLIKSVGELTFFCWLTEKEVKQCYTEA